MADQHPQKKPDLQAQMKDLLGNPSAKAKLLAEMDAYIKANTYGLFIPVQEPPPQDITGLQGIQSLLGSPSIGEDVWSLIDPGPLYIPSSPPSYKPVGAMWSIPPQAVNNPIPAEPLPRRKSQETILAWRAWHLHEDADGPVLTSVVKDFLWKGPVVHSDGKPNENNKKGLYAVKDTYRRSLKSHYQYDEWCVMGEVQLFGTIVVCERGYRAEHALIRSLAVRCPPGMIPDPRLAERYACEVTIWKED